MKQKDREEAAAAGGTMVALGATANTSLGATLTGYAMNGVAATKVGAVAAFIITNPIALMGLGLGVLAVAAFSKSDKR